MVSHLYELYCEHQGEIYLQKVSSKLYLYEHHKSEHDEPNPNKCKICLKVFAYKSHLVTHSRVHTGEKPFVCSTCGRGFAQKGHLQSHQETHREVRKHKCTVCPEGRFFKTKGDLTEHMKFHRSSHLNEHMKNNFHPIFSCLTCGKQFNRYTSLKQHKKTHLH